MELDRLGAELIFQVLTEREEKNCVAIAPKESFGKRTCSGELVRGGAEIRELAGQGACEEVEITGVPSTIVNGKYCADLGMAQSPDGLLHVADGLIAVERASQ